MVSPRQMVTRPIVRPRMLSVCDVTRVSPAPMRDNEPLMTISGQQHPILIHILITGHRPHVPRIPAQHWGPISRNNKQVSKYITASVSHSDVIVSDSIEPQTI